MKKGIVTIEDVTARARELQRAIENEQGADWENLVARGLVLREEAYELEPELKEILGMMDVLDCDDYRFHT